MGLRQRTTHGKHYCDFTNDYIQLMLYFELERWASGLLKDKEQDFYSHQFSTQYGEYSGNSGVVPGKTSGVMLTINATEPSSLTIHPQVRCGYTGQAIMEGGGEGK